jgi:hypothetical protein
MHMIRDSSKYRAISLSPGAKPRGGKDARICEAHRMIFGTPGHGQPAPTILAFRVPT